MQDPNLSEQLFPHKTELLYQLGFPALKWKSLLPTDTKIDGLVHDSVIIGNNVQINLETQIDPFVVIEENVIIGKNCFVKTGAYIRSGTIIGDNVVIGHCSEIKKSYLCDDVKVGSHCFVGNSVIGKGARIGSGSITGNRRFDQNEVKWELSNKQLESAQDKVGLLLGDYARLGANVTTNPGSIIGSYTWISGGQVVAGFVASKQFQKPTGELVENRQSKELSSNDQDGER